MDRLLPRAADAAEFRRAKSQPEEHWHPAIRVIAARHGLECDEITRFPSGEHPVFASGHDWVLKLVPSFASKVLTRETALLDSLPAGSKVLRPTMLGQGELEGWRYLVSTRLAGTPLHRVWPSLGRAEQEALAEDFGRLLRTLHDELLEFGKTGHFEDWNTFVRQAVAGWPTRWGVDRLPEPLRTDGPRFLAALGLGESGLPASRMCRLHGDLAPENALAQEIDGTWRMTGMIDFGNARLGDPLFDYTAPTVLLQAGDPVIVRRFLTGAGVAQETPLCAMRLRLMAYTLIHPMADLCDCLELLPGAVTCASWDEVAERFWRGE